MSAYIPPPPRIPWYLRLAIWISERQTGKEMLVARILAWYPKAAIGSGLLESFVAHKDKTVSERLLKLVPQSQARCRLLLTESRGKKAEQTCEKHTHAVMRSFNG
jgi:hypothetical protein